MLAFGGAAARLTGIKQGLGRADTAICWPQREEEFAAVGLIIAALVAKSFTGRRTNFPYFDTHRSWVGPHPHEWGILLRASFCEIRLT